MRNFYGFTLPQLEEALGAAGNEKYRARQLYQWIYGRGVRDFGEMTNISKGLRRLFMESFDTTLLSVREVRESRDGSVKFAFAGPDGRVFESVFMPEETRNTLCLSTQIGCRMGCRFCVTGKIGFVRNLSVAEIVGQVVTARVLIGERRISNIVFMGMGEPLDNMEALVAALSILKEPLGLDFSHRRITISTVGLLDPLRQLGYNAASIAISLNAASNEKRNRLMPINRMYPIESIISFVRDFKAPNRTRITFEYVLVEGVNDSLDDAKDLVALLREIKCKINLIPLNPSRHLEFRRPADEQVRAFQEYLLEKRFTAIVRESRGADVSGGCGQLGIRYLEEDNEGRTPGL